MRRARFIVLVAIIMLPLAGSSAAQSGRARRATPPAPPPAQPKVEEPPPVTRHAPVPVDAKFDTKYVGGSLGVENDEKITIRIKDGVVTLVTKKDTYEVPAINIENMSYGTSVRKRTAEAIGVGTVVPGLGGIIGKSKSTAHYIEIEWNLPPMGGVALRVDKDDYKGLIAALEGATGLEVKLDPAPLVTDFP